MDVARRLRDGTIDALVVVVIFVMVPTIMMVFIASDGYEKTSAQTRCE